MMEEHEWDQISPYLENMVLKIKEYRITHNCDLTTARFGVLDLACEKYNESKRLVNSTLDATRQ